MRIAIAGATGLVGQKILQVLEERDFSITELIPIASAKSVGNSLTFRGKAYTIHSFDQALAKKPQIALFSCGSGPSLEWAPKFAEIDCYVIDNSSAWRMDKNVPLVVPEVNAKSVLDNHRIIANPNCSTIQMVMALAPLHARFGIKRLVISTYQSITGTGMAAVQQMMDEREGKTAQKVYPYAIDRNCLPHCDVFEANDYTKEEMKLVNETCKILADDQIKVTATCVRVPVMGGHSESLNIEFNKDFEIKELRQLLAKTPGIEVQDNPAENLYPMPLNAHESDSVFVGRIRRDHSQENTLNMWVVSDNLRKGAATNAVQIAEYLQIHGKQSNKVLNTLS